MMNPEDFREAAEKLEACYAAAREYEKQLAVELASRIGPRDEEGWFDPGEVPCLASPEMLDVAVDPVSPICQPKAGASCQLFRERRRASCRHRPYLCRRDSR